MVVSGRNGAFLMEGRPLCCISAISNGGIQKKGVHIRGTAVSTPWTDRYCCPSRFLMTPGTLLVRFPAHSDDYFKSLYRALPGSRFDSPTAVRARHGPDSPRQSRLVSIDSPDMPRHNFTTKARQFPHVCPVKHCQAVKHPPDSPTARQPDSARQCPTLPDSDRQLDSS